MRKTFGVLTGCAALWGLSTLVPLDYEGLQAIGPGASPNFGYSIRPTTRDERPASGGSQVRTAVASPGQPANAPAKPGTGIRLVRSGTVSLTSSDGATVAAGPKQPHELRTQHAQAQDKPESGSQPLLRKTTSAKPRDENARRQLSRDLQAELRRVGCYSGPLDGQWNQSTRKAMSSFNQHVNAMLPVEEPDYVLLTLVERYMDRACGQGCTAGQAPAPDGHCVTASVAADARRKATSEPTNGEARANATPKPSSEEARRRDVARKAEHLRVAEEARRTDESRRQWETKWLEELRKADADRGTEPQNAATARVDERRNEPTHSAAATPPRAAPDTARPDEAERKAKLAEAQKLEERRKVAEALEARKLAEAQHQEELKRLVNARKAEEQRKLAEAAEARKQEDLRKAAEAREVRRLAEARKLDEQKRLADAQRQAQDRKDEEQRRVAAVMQAAESWNEAKRRSELPPPSGLGAPLPPPTTASVMASQGAVQVLPPTLAVPQLPDGAAAGSASAPVTGVGDAAKAPDGKATPGGAVGQLYVVKPPKAPRLAQGGSTYSRERAAPYRYAPPQSYRTFSREAIFRPSN